MPRPIPNAADLADAERFIAEARRFEVSFQRDLRPMSGLDWHVTFYGDGDWCRGAGQVHRFSSEIAARAAGRRWVREGTL